MIIYDLPDLQDAVRVALVKPSPAAGSGGAQDAPQLVVLQDRLEHGVVVELLACGNVKLGAKDCTPEMSKGLSLFQWIFHRNCPMDFQWHFPMEFHV